MRTESTKPVRNGGHLHRLADVPWNGRRVAQVKVRSNPTIDFGKLAERYERAADAARVACFAQQLGVSVESLRRLQVGFDGEAWTIPMQNAAGRIVGIRRRFASGRKLSVKGGHEGLFVPAGLVDGGELYVTEGPTDCAALLTLYIDAIGRPSCNGGVVELAAYANRHAPASIVILADGDSAGHVGAHALALGLRLSCPIVRVVYPPNGANDAREWVQLGATKDIIRRHAATTKPIQLAISGF